MSFISQLFSALPSFDLFFQCSNVFSSQLLRIDFFSNNKYFSIFTWVLTAYAVYTLDAPKSGGRKKFTLCFDLRNH